jgi:potassium efflux system protein
VNSTTLFNHHRLATLIAILLLGYLVVSPPATGQDVLIAGVTITEEDTAAQIKAAIAAIEAREGLDAETQSKVLEQLRAAEVQLQNKFSAGIAAEQFAAALISAPQETNALLTVLDEQPPLPATAESLDIDGNLSLAELQQWLARETAELTAIDSEVAEFNSQVEVQVARPAVIRERIGQLERNREKLTSGASDMAVAGEEQILASARKLAIQMRRAALGAEINKLEQELLSHGVRLDLIRAKRDVAARAQMMLQQRTNLLRAAVNELQLEADKQAREAASAAELAAADKHSVVRSLAEENADLVVNLPKGAADIQEASTQLAEVKTKTSSIEQRLARSRQHIEIGGLSRTTGRLLVEERRNLPKITRYRPRDAEIAEVGLALMFIQEQRRQLTPLEDRTQEILADVVGSISDEEELITIADEVRFLLRSRRNFLLQAENSYRSYLKVLGDLDIAQAQLLNSANEYEEFLNQSLLWIPSAPIAFNESWSDLKSAAKWAVSTESWRQSFAVLGLYLMRHPMVATVFLLLFGLVVLARSPLAATYKSMSKRIGRLSTDSIGLTLGSLAIAVVQALPVPMFLAGASWFLSKSPEATAFSDTFAQSLSATATFLFNTLVLRTLSAPDGVFRTHFGWSSENVALIRRQVGKLATIGASLIFATVFMFVSEGAADKTNLGRFVFIPLMLFFAFIVNPLMHPDSGLAANYYKTRPESWISKYRRAWHYMAIGVPLILALISILGNVYTSTKLARLFVDSIWFAVGLIIINMVVLRWLALSRRKLELKILLQKREAQKAEREAGAQPGAESDTLVPATEPLDLEAVDHQSKTLLRSGLVLVAAIAGWQIWSDVLPAFSLLENVSLWSQKEMVDGVEIITPVTLADLFLAVLVILVSAIAARNLPGFMEIALPQRLSVEPGSRYAINTLVRYFIIMVGVILVLNIIGWNWSQIQWLVAALTVGLGFGLQEIVANFVSGLVILFERPVRVGDTVTVGELTGTVSRIRIRATTITDWDRKEIIVPNKSFITEQVINWTLTDPITRIVIPVGVSYGSDVTEVHKVMEDTLPTVPLVLDDPAPRVYFSGFGESSLDFNLHVYLRQLTDRMPLVHEVHNAIFKALRANGIEIPFPQRDLHIRSTVEPSKT